MPRGGVGGCIIGSAGITRGGGCPKFGSNGSGITRGGTFTVFLVGVPLIGLEGLMPPVPFGIFVHGTFGPGITFGGVGNRGPGVGNCGIGAGTRGIGVGTRGIGVGTCGIGAGTRGIGAGTRGVGIMDGGSI